MGLFIYLFIFVRLVKCFLKICQSFGLQTSTVGITRSCKLVRNAESQDPP